MLVRARDAGKVRHLGFSAHSAEVAIELMNRYEFDSVLFPVNFTTWYESGFGPQIMSEAERRGIYRLALKGVAHHGLADGQDRVREKCWYAPIEDRELMKLALRWTLSQPVTAAIPPGDPELWQMAVELAHNFISITSEEEVILKNEAKNKRPLFQLTHA